MGLFGYNKYIDDSGEVNMQMIQKDKDTVFIKSLIFDCILPVIYILGIVAIGIFGIVSFMVFCRKIGKKHVSDSRILRMLDLCKAQLNIRKNIEVIEQRVIRVPSLFGVFRTKILVCDNIYKMSDEQIKYIFMHELVHDTKWDLLKNVLFNILQVVYWFNPIVHLCFKNIRKDMEVTTDNIAISHLNEWEHKEYCKVLLEIATSGEGSGSVYDKNAMLANRVLGISNDKKSLEERISMIKNSEKFSKNKWLIGIIGLVLVVLLGVIFCTNKLATIPPELYATVNGQTYIKFIRGGYEWNTMFESVIADAPMPRDFDYTDVPTLNVSVGDSIRLTNVKNRYNLGGNKFYTSDVRYYKENGEEIVLDSISAPMEMDSKETIISSPDEVGTYILSISVDYYGSGKAQYGIKVIVGYDMEKFERYSNTYIGDAPKVNAILNMIQYSQYLNGMELHTTNKPYGMTVNYTGVNVGQEGLEFNSVVLFSLIENLDSIEYVIDVNDVNDRERVVNVKRGDYADVVTLNYMGLVDYINRAEERNFVKSLKKVYLPMFTHLYSHLDWKNNYDVDPDSLIMESIIWGYYSANPNAETYSDEGGYPSKMIRDAYYEMTGKQLSHNISGLGIYPYIQEKDYFLVAADWNMPLVNNISNVSYTGDSYIVEYEYCYPSESDVLNLPMVEIEPNTYTLAEGVYEQYIEGLEKYKARIELRENIGYEYIKWQVVAREKM